MRSFQSQPDLGGPRGHQQMASLPPTKPFTFYFSLIRPVCRKWNGGLWKSRKWGCFVKSGPFLNVGCIMYSISVFFYFTFYLFVGDAPCHEGGISVVTVRVLWAEKSSPRLNCTNSRCVCVKRQQLEKYKVTLLLWVTVQQQTKLLIYRETTNTQSVQIN